MRALRSLSVAGGAEPGECHFGVSIDSDIRPDDGDSAKNYSVRPSSINIACAGYFFEHRDGSLPVSFLGRRR